MKEFYTTQEGGEEGYRRHQHGKKAAVASAVSLLADVESGRARDWYIKEAIAPSSPDAARTIDRNYPGIFRINEAGQTTSDFTYLTGDILDRMMLARYRRYPQNWRQYCKVSRPLRDFRTTRRIPLDGLEGTWEDIPESGEVQDASLSDGDYGYTPKKYGQATTVSFEAIMNDDLDGFMSIPERLGDGGNNTVDKFVTELYVDASGPHASFYTGGNGNIVTSNPELSVAALNTAFTIFGTQTNTDGAPIYVEEAVLTVGPALRITAQNLMNQILVDVTETGGTSNQTVRVNNYIVANLTLVINPWIPIVASTANGPKSWFLFANPSVSRPALEVGFIRGLGEPALYQKMSNTMRVGGGQEQTAGDFETMSHRYKGIIGFGGGRQDPKMTVASNGSNS